MEAFFAMSFRAKIRGSMARLAKQNYHSCKKLMDGISMNMHVRKDRDDQEYNDLILSFNDAEEQS